MSLAPDRLSIGITRHFTAPGVHPYDEVEWERRDARISNWKDGTVAFEQLGVEFPTNWSLNATNIVAQKYFRGTLGLPEREWSLKQVIYRVANTVTTWGIEGGYFADQAETDAFNNELKYILVTQRAAFNSPVWFNIGVKGVPQQASACFILAVEDTMDGILNWYKEEGVIFKGGSGSGINLSNIRSSYELLNGGGTASGPVSFMRGADASAGTIKSGGKTRRAAKMVILNVDHPDVEEFIWCKVKEERKARVLRDAGFDMDLDGSDSFSIQYQNANNSVRVSDEFMQAVREYKAWRLAFPVRAAEIAGEDTSDHSRFLWREWPDASNYVRNEEGLVLCKVYKTLPAKRMCDVIMSSTYDFAEPGFVLIDRVNEMNNNWWCETIRATNPCGEQPLPPYGSCLLGSLNLTRFVLEPFTENARFDWEEFRKVVKVFTRMLDNVVEINGLPLEQQRNEITRKRRHGMGFLGLGSTITMLRMKYGSREAVGFTERVSKELAIAGWEAGLALAEEKGPAPIMTEEFVVTAEMLRKRPEMVRDGIKAGDRLPGRILHARYSRYPELVEELAEVGARFTHHSSIAPTGTISLSLANNASNGIEPSFAHHYSRNVIREGKKTKEKVDVYSFELLAYRELVNPKAMQFAEDAAARLPDYFISADDVKPKEHVDVQAAAQKWVDSSISKTANVPTDFPY